MEIINNFLDVNVLEIRQETRGEEGYEYQVIIVSAHRDMESLAETGTEKIVSQVEIDANAAVHCQDLPIEGTAWIDGCMALYLSSPTDVTIIDPDEVVEVPHGPDFGTPKDPTPIIYISDKEKYTPPLHTDS